MTALMRAHERHLGTSLGGWLEEQYRHKTLAGIANDLDLDESTVSKWFKRLGIPTSHRKLDSDGEPATASAARGENGTAA